MSGYYFAMEDGSSPFFVFPDEYDEVLPDPIFKYPSKSLPLFASLKPEEPYDCSIDFIKFPDIAFSRKIFDSVNLKYIYGVNWVPVTIIDNNEFHFLMLQVANEIRCFDIKESLFREIDSDGFINGVQKVALNKELLNTIPLNQRLVFRSYEWGKTFFHESIVKKIEAVSPRGVKFLPVENYEKGMI